MKGLSVLLLSALLGAASASAADAQRESPREKALMLYFSKSFGAKSDARTPLAFGLRLQQSSPLDTGHSVAIVDARYSLGGPSFLALAGVPALSLGSEKGGSSGGSSGASSAFRRNNPGMTAVMIAVALVGGACLFEVGICEDDPDRSPGETPGPTTPGTGTGG